MVTHQGGQLGQTLEELTVLSKDEDNPLKDSMDRSNEMALKRAREASLVILSGAVIANFDRVVWADDLLKKQEPGSREQSSAYLRIKRAAEFIADASQDTIQFGDRAQAAALVNRQNVWLKHWNVGVWSKTTLAKERFSGHLLFNESNLEKVLVETKDKKNV